MDMIKFSSILAVKFPKVLVALPPCELLYTLYKTACTTDICGEVVYFIST